MKTVQRNISVFQQTKILLWKNVLIKWRMKMQSFQEWILSLLFLPLVFMVASLMHQSHYAEVPFTLLGHLDDPAFNATGATVTFTPATATTRHIMSRVASSSVMKGGFCSLVVVFLFFYSCHNFSWEYCESPRYWYKGFLSLQSSIDAAIIEMVTNHSVWEEMKSIAGVRMKSQSILFSISLEYSYFMVVIVMCFLPFMYFLSRHVTREKKQLKVLMKTMGLQDIAFWLSWSLLYSLYVLLFSCLLTALLLREPFYTSSFPAVSLLLFLYGLACIHLVFMLSSLLKTAKLVSSMGFLIIFIFGFLSLAVLIEEVPEPLKWFLGLLCPFAFNTGIAKVRGHHPCFSFSNLMEEAHFLFSTYILLVFDSVLYMLLALYFDKILPGKYGMPDPPLFCLKASYWMRSRRGSTRDVPRASANPEEQLGDDVEPVPPEFLGKEAIRIHNIKKAYKKKDKKTEALRGLSLTIYEGQITALLGHSGAGKTTLLNVLSGLSFPSEGSATIYNYKLSEMGDREEIRGLVGICPQFNSHFEVLTVRENLKTFAEIKGIKSKEVEQEVENILELLDISNIQDTQAEKLSGGQKRKLSIGIAMLGNPQVLLLDEPTAGLDPLSRHQVWSLLRERRAGRAILFSTQFMDEADILADRKAFISHGRLKCVGSSLFLKKKWGICYHLRIHVSESCDLENLTSLVKGHIPNATFSGHTQYELRYKLPLENVNKFPDLFSGLDSCSEQGIINYGVSLTTLEDVFLRLEGEATADPEGAIHNPHPNTSAAQPYLLLYAVFLLPLVLQLCVVAGWQSVSAWQLSPERYFLPLGRRPHLDATTLLVYNHTGEGGEGACPPPSQVWADAAPKGNTGQNGKSQEFSPFFSCSSKSYRFTVLCHLEAINCFPVLVNVISNTLLRTLNSTEHIQVWSHPFFSSHDGDWFYSLSISWAIPMGAVGQPGTGNKLSFKIVPLQAGARAQLRISGLFPSAYWCGQALVDIPLCWILLFSMFGLQFAISNKVSGSASTFFLLVGPILVLAGLLGRDLGENILIHAVHDYKLILLLPPHFQKSVIIVNNLCKEYEIKQAGSFFKKKKKAATKNLSFCVKKGEVLGLLGPNGAGKSTAIKMITGETALTAGQRGGGGGSQEQAPAFLGYCPQENPLWLDLTPQIVIGLQLQDYLNKKVRKLPAGITRKLCVALSMLGNPSVLLLDEPCTGMDPNGQRRVWKAIRDALKAKESGAILTTHYMEEAEAVCDRVAILVSGQLRCIGSIQYLKNKFGKGYLLEIKVKDAESTDVLHAEILKIFPGAARQERFPCLLVYKVPMKDALPLSQSFSKLEEAKQSCSLEEYSFSLNTLTQVFLELSREQEKDNFDLTLDGTFDWKQLQQEDC
uniref:ATP binding cassette subfamily A member 10 n=1 Tax=Ficedula albicollis TaxID=59894 RepID=A0A803VGY4_FICAL